MYYTSFFILKDDETASLNSTGSQKINSTEERRHKIKKTAPNCFPEQVCVNLPFFAGDDDSTFWVKWANLRLKAFNLIKCKYYETAVLTMIVLSCAALVSCYLN